MKSGEAFITPRSFAFLRELAAHNERPWFERNKQRYLDDVRDPLLRFVAAFAPRLAKLSPHFVADPRPVGGSLFRIYRDVRFAKDKSPYKTHAALSFRHVEGRERPAPGFYLHLAPGDVFAGAGLWHAPPEAVKQVRDAIVAKPAAWKKVTRACPLDASEDTLEAAAAWLRPRASADRGSQAPELHRRPALHAGAGMRARLRGASCEGVPEPGAPAGVLVRGAGRAVVGVRA